MINKKHQTSEEIKDLLREVEDDMAWQSIKTFFFDNRTFISIIILMVVFFAVGLSIYKNHQAKQSIIAENAFYELLYSENKNGNGDGLSASAGYNALVAFSEVERHIKNNRISDAQAGLKKILLVAPPPLKNLAILSLGYLNPDSHGQLDESLLALSKNQSSPLSAMAQDSVAFHLLSSDDKKANSMWQTLEKSDIASQSLKQRAKIMQKSKI